MASYIPSIFPEQTPQNVMPGQSYIPSVPMAGGTFNAANYAGLSDYEKNKLASLASGSDFFMADAFMNSIKDKYSADGLGWGEQRRDVGTPIWDEFHAMNASSGGSGGESGGAETAGTGQVGGSTGQVGGSTGQFGGGLLGGSTLPNTTTPGGLTGFPTIGEGLLTGQGTSGSIPGTSGQVGGGAVPMGVNSNALQNYYNTPGYQLTNSQDAVNTFQTSPGYQFAVDQALGQVARQGASRGLLDSGAGLRALTDRAQGMANQEFNNWQQNQQNQYNQYQNRLQGLASGPTGSEQAFALGQGIGANNMVTGGNIGSILANQGNSLFGGIVGAGGAQAQNVSQAGNMQAQILGGNLQTQMMLAALAAGRR